MTADTPLVSCPNCHAELVSPESAACCLCPSCGAFFQRERGATATVRLSRRAVGSFLLGTLSLVGLMLTGIPAVILGILALRDIHAQPEQLRGRGWALAGIAGGCLLGMTCGPLVAAISLQTVTMLRSIVDSNEPDKIAALAEQMNVPAPAGLEPLRAVNHPPEGLRFLGYGDLRGTVVVVAEQPDYFGPEAMDRQLRAVLDRFDLELTEPTQREATVELLGREVQLQVTHGRNPKRDAPVEQLSLNLHRRPSRLAVLWMTVDPQAEDEEQRRQRLVEFAERLGAEAPAEDE